MFHWFIVWAYPIVIGGSGADFFSLEPKSRQLKVIKEIDRELNENFELIVHVGNESSGQQPPTLPSRVKRFRGEDHVSRNPTGYKEELPTL